MERKIPLKNYIILGLIFLATVLVTFYVRGWYNTTKEYYAQNSVMTKVTREIKSEEISNYTLENQKFVLYTSSGQNMDIKDFEDKFKDSVKKLELDNDMLYLNLDGVDINEFTSNLKNNFASNDRIKDQITSDSSVSLYLFTEGKITYVINNAQEYSMNRLEIIIKKWGVSNA